MTQENKRIVILTGSDLRHEFFRKALGVSEGITVVRSCCESMENTLRDVVENRPPRERASLIAHLDARDRSEQDFFGPFCRLVPDHSEPALVSRGRINDASCVDEIIALQPDLVVAYGCSIIREPLLSSFTGRFINVHLGLSPYYRGAGTNFWPLVNGEPEYVGVTFMHIDAGIDTGEIIHQIRPRIFPGDSPHQIGNRLIGDMVSVCADIVQNFERLETMPQPDVPTNIKVYKRKDVSGAATKDLYRNFAEGMVDRYLSEYETRASRVPIVQNTALTAE